LVMGQLDVETTHPTTSRQCKCELQQCQTQTLMCGLGRMAPLWV
jgi:hypothetical protein